MEIRFHGFNRNSVFKKKQKPLKRLRDLYNARPTIKGWAVSINRAG